MNRLLGLNHRKCDWIGCKNHASFKKPVKVSGYTTFLCGHHIRLHSMGVPFGS